MANLLGVAFRLAALVVGVVLTRIYAALTTGVLVARRGLAAQLMVSAGLPMYDHIHALCSYPKSSKTDG